MTFSHHEGMDNSLYSIPFNSVCIKRVNVIIFNILEHSKFNSYVIHKKLMGVVLSRSVLVDSSRRKL